MWNICQTRSSSMNARVSQEKRCGERGVSLFFPASQVPYNTFTSSSPARKPRPSMPVLFGRVIIDDLRVLGGTISTVQWMFLPVRELSPPSFHHWSLCEKSRLGIPPLGFDFKGRRGETVFKTASSLHIIALSCRRCCRCGPLLPCFGFGSSDGFEPSLWAPSIKVVSLLNTEVLKQFLHGKSILGYPI